MLPVYVKLIRLHMLSLEEFLIAQLYKVLLFINTKSTSLVSSVVSLVVSLVLLLLVLSLVSLVSIVSLIDLIPNWIRIKYNNRIKNVNNKIRIVIFIIIIIM